jgi:Holliday junction resolvase-like predicted endonuclease
VTCLIRGDKIDNVEAKKLERWIRAAAVFLS